MTKLMLKPLQADGSLFSLKEMVPVYNKSNQGSTQKNEIILFVVLWIQYIQLPKALRVTDVYKCSCVPSPSESYMI